MPPVPRSTYRAALLLARRRSLALSAAEARQVVRSLSDFADAIGRKLRKDFGSIRDADSLVSGRVLDRTRVIAREAARDLARELEQSIASGRRTSFNQVLGVWDKAGATAARSAGIDLAAMGAVRAAPVTMLGAFEAIGGAGTWKTALRGHIGAGAQEAAQIIRLGFLEGVGPDELARRLRRHVVGSEPFHQLFKDVPTLSGDVAKIDLRRIPGEMRGAAKRMRYNAERIAVSETVNARHEAEVQHMIEDPLVEAVQWALSPDRGETDVDECDVLATADVYGLGPGVYPVYAVPGPPHPFDRSLAPWTPVLSGDGWKPVAEVAPGEFVFSHRGRWCKVEESISGRRTGGWLEVELNDGGTLTITEDHPILTADRNWTDAGLLTAGDLVVALDRSFHDQFNESIPSGFREIVPLECEKGPTLSLQQSGLPRVLALLLGRPMPPPMYFDGKFDGRDGNIDVKATDRPEGFRLDASAPESRAHTAFMRRNLLLAAINAERDLASLLFGLRSTSEESSRMLGGATTLDRICEAQYLRLRAAPSRNPAADQVLSNNVPTYAEALGDLVFWQALLDIQFSKRALIERVAGPQFVSVQIRHIRPLRCHLRRYCLTVAKDNSFVVAGGVVVHNCENLPVTRSLSMLTQAKPLPDRVLAMSDFRVPSSSGLTVRQVASIRERAEQAITIGQRVIQRAAA